MAVTLAARETTTTAPAAGASWTGSTIELRSDGPQGPLAKASLVDFFIWHEGQPFTYFVEGSEDGVTWQIIQSAAVAAHVAGNPGTFVSPRVPSKFGRVRVLNTGAAPAVAFRVWSSWGVL